LLVPQGNLPLQTFRKRWKRLQPVGRGRWRQPAAPTWLSKDLSYPNYACLLRVSVQKQHPCASECLQTMPVLRTGCESPDSQPHLSEARRPIGGQNQFASSHNEISGGHAQQIFIVPNPQLWILCFRRGWLYQKKGILSWRVDDC
jgi:hypothetical protein